jgi:L-2-hydroxyglutarate oxidase LhgO
VARFDVAVVGAGIIGLATARALALGGRRVAVVEKERELATHQSGHNSGVIHSGIYYAPGSLKARLCVEGKRELELYAEERGIPFRRAGKLIVALDESELPRLAELKRRGLANGVEGLREVDADELRAIEPNAVGLRALHAPGTGIIDYRAVAAAYADDVRAAGGEVLLGRRVTRVTGGGELETADGAVVASHVVVCAGVQADRLAHRGPRIVPFRGDYYTLSDGARSLVRGLVYPVPDPRFPFLGVHFTKRIDGEVWAGPNAVLAFAREGYRRRDINPGDLARTLAFRGFQRLATKYLRTGLAEMWRDWWKPAFVGELRLYVPEIGSDDLQFGP